MSTSQTVPLGNLGPWSGAGDYNTIVYAIRGQLSKINTATLCQVKACTHDGGLAPFGFVDVLPLVSQVDGAGNPVPHVTLYKLPYLRLQGGSSAIICDPAPGDLGIALFCNRDITSVVATQGQSTPSSPRMFDWSDGLYLGGLLNAAPTQYLQFNSGGIAVVSPQAVKVTAPSISMGASGSTPQTLMTDSFLQYWTTKVLPFLTGLGFTGGPAPADSITTSVEGA